MKLYRHMILALALSISIIPVQAIGWPTSQTITACLSRPKELLIGAYHIASSAGKSLFAHKAATTALATACAILTFSKTRNALLWAPFRASFALARHANNPYLFVDILRLALWSKIYRVTDLIKYLKSTNLETTDNYGHTTLHWAAFRGNLNAVQALITANANKDAMDANGRAPLHLAASQGHLETVQALLDAGANKEATDNFGRTSLHYAACFRHLEVVHALLNTGANKEAADNQGRTPLHYAVRHGHHGHLEVVHALLSANANKEATDDQSMTPLHVAVYLGNINAVQALITANANKDAMDANGQTPLHLAAQSLHIVFSPMGARNLGVETIKALVVAGANIEATDNNGNTPLHSAVQTGESLEAVKALVGAGANIATQNHAQQTALDIAQANGKQDVVNYLSNVPQLASNLQKAVREGNLCDVTKFLAAGTPVTMPDEQGNTVIHLSIGDYEHAKPTTSDICARTLLRYAGPAALTLRNAKGHTPLHIAAQKGNCWIAECLLRRRPDLIAEQDNEGNTPLHYATSIAMRDKLLRHGADASLINDAGQTPLSRNPGTWQSLWLPDQNLHSTPNATLPL